VSDTESETPEQLFLRFHYAEVKDLAKHFLTLIAGSLVLSVSFAEKILPLASASPGQRWLLGGCWLALLFSLVLAGLGLFTNYLAGEQAHGGIIYDYRIGFRVLVQMSYLFLDVAALAFGMALVLLAATGVTRYFR
jgi:hypothetical protein